MGRTEVSVVEIDALKTAIGDLKNRMSALEYQMSGLIAILNMAVAALGLGCLLGALHWWVTHR